MIMKSRNLIQNFVYITINEYIKQISARKSNSFNSDNKSILIVRLDAIGDYILFRNYLEIIKNTFKNYRVILAGNITWKNIAEELDREFVDEFI